MTLETALKAASMQRMPTPNTTEGAPSAAMAAVGVMRTAGTAAPAAISSGVPRSCACGPGVPRNATLRTATNATSATHSVINLDERAMAEPFAILIVRMQPTLEPQIQHKNDTMCNLCNLRTLSKLKAIKCCNSNQPGFLKNLIGIHRNATKLAEYASRLYAMVQLFEQRTPTSNLCTPASCRV